MLAAQETDGAFTDDEIIGNTFTLLLAGEDTTAHTMAWTIWFLSSMQEIQAQRRVTASQSTRNGRGVAGRSGRMNRRTKGRAPTAIGTLTQKIQRQENRSVT